MVCVTENCGDTWPHDVLETKLAYVSGLPCRKESLVFALGTVIPCYQCSIQL